MYVEPTRYSLNTVYRSADATPLHCQPQPTTTCPYRELLHLLAKNEMWGNSWAFDDICNLYTPVDVLPPEKTAHRVEFSEAGRREPRVYSIEIAYANRMDLGELLRWVR